ncbi:MAG: gamma-glutamylcyclotransferase family protein [Euryarchaeota archaeon]|nr:gamma-glutamylcyclotransferase family protein [Euryarchaeota archaeon]
MEITKTVTENWWQSREMRPYLIESISHFNEARVYSRKNDEIGTCKSIFKGLSILRTGLNNDLCDGDAFFDCEPDCSWQSIEWLFDHPSNRLAVYGTLRQGESNHGVIEHITGEWIPGFVHGYVEEYYGFPFFVWAEADKIPVEVLSSSELCNSWELIDRFEGRWYDRILIPVCDSDDDILFIANIYCKSSRKCQPQNDS